MTVKKATKINKSSSVSVRPSVNVKVKKSTPKVAAVRDKQTRTEIFQVIAEQTNLTKVQVESVFDALNRSIESHMKKRGSGEFIIPKIGIKVRRVKKKASKERTMISPLLGEEVTIAAKPARVSVKLSALKVLKSMVDA